MLNRAFFNSILTRLSYFVSVLRPSSTATANTRKLSTNPEVLHHVISDDLLRKFDEVIIIGDVHGCFDELMLLIDQMSLNNSTKIDQKRYFAST